MIKSKERKQFLRNLHKWYKTHKRDLPWRKTKDPYKIWVSEIILQQTRVVQGLPYYENFIRLFPTLTSLARAEEDKVLKAWQGLGYYTRARNLLSCAKWIHSELNGIFPDKYEELMKLKGIGPYTASAIGSIAFNMPLALVDGNVSRVLSRLFQINKPFTSGSVNNAYNTTAKILMNKKYPGEFNQALMELGALVCLPASPHCVQCPVSFFCKSYKNKTIDNYPVIAQKKESKKRYFNYLVFTTEKDLWLKKRTGNDIWKGLYEFYVIEDKKILSLKEIVDFIQKNKIQYTDEINTLFQKKHILSHQVIQSVFYQIKIKITEKNRMLIDKLGLQKITKTNLKQYPFHRLAELCIEKYF